MIKRNLYSVYRLIRLIPELQFSNAGNKITWWFVFLLDTVRKPMDVYNMVADRIDNLLRYNGQSMYIERALNDTFDPDQQRIYITSAYADNKLYLYSKSEQRTPVYLYNKSENSSSTYIYNSNETEFDVDFIVYVDHTITYDESRMRAIINQYKLYGKTYKIVVI